MNNDQHSPQNGSLLDILRQVVAAVLVFALIIGMLLIFYQQELRYMLPTPVPKSYAPVAVGQAVALTDLIEQREGKPLFLHFFNPECPCSRFNIDHFKSLVKTYKNDIDFYALVQAGDEGYGAQDFADRYGLGIPTALDVGNRLADACGAYSTPQAVLIDAGGKLYFRGNYNKTRYCTDKDTYYAQLALDSLLESRPPPSFGQLADRAYGCELPDVPARVDASQITACF